VKKRRIEKSGSTGPFSGDRTLTRVLVALLLVLTLFAIAAIVVPQYLITRNALERHSEDVLASTIKEAQENTGAFLQKSEDIAHLTRGLVSTGVLSLDDDEQLDQYFREQIRVHSQVDGIYVGRGDGSFVFSKRVDDSSEAAIVTKFIQFSDAGVRRVHRVQRNAEGEITSRSDDSLDKYDPRRRPWYAQALASDVPVWTQPYVFFTSGRPGLTMAATVGPDSADGPTVIGVDLDLNQVSGFLQSKFSDSPASALILNRDGSVVAHSKPLQLARKKEDGDLRLVTADELDDTTMVAVSGHKAALNGHSLDPKFHTFKSNGEKHIAVFKPFLDQSKFPWTMGVYAPSVRFAQTLRSGQTNTIIWAVILTTLMALMAVFLSNRILRPIERRLQRQAVEDPLTELMNRRRFLEVSVSDFEQCGIESKSVSAIMLDIDKFKLINDEHGHHVGDTVLRAVAGRLRHALSEKDHISRYGGDEFAIVLPDTNFPAAIEVARRLHDAVGKQQVNIGSESIPITISVGVAVSGGAIASLDELLNEADQRLLVAKRGGRNQVVYDEIESTLTAVP